MGLTKPYFRIFRPNLKRGRDLYLLDNRYADDRQHMILAYHTVEQDLKRIFDFIDPTDDNFKTYSHRLYELFLRASTEVECNCKAILKANKYSKKKEKYWKIENYQEIDAACKLSDYEVVLNVLPIRKKFFPFAEWKNNSKLTWYSEYNSVKHNRSVQFKKANLENVITSVAAAFIMLFAQFNGV